MNPCDLNCFEYILEMIFILHLLCRLKLLKIKYPFCKQQSSFLTRSTFLLHHSKFWLLIHSSIWGSVRREQISIKIHSIGFIINIFYSKLCKYLQKGQKNSQSKLHLKVWTTEVETQEIALFKCFVNTSFSIATGLYKIFRTRFYFFTEALELKLRYCYQLEGRGISKSLSYHFTGV